MFQTVQAIHQDTGITARIILRAIEQGTLSNAARRSGGKWLIDDESDEYHAFVAEALARKRVRRQNDQRSAAEVAIPANLMLLTEVAPQIGVEMGALHQAARNRRIGAVMINNRWYVDPENQDFKIWQEEHWLQPRTVGKILHPDRKRGEKSFWRATKPPDGYQVVYNKQKGLYYIVHHGRYLIKLDTGSRKYFHKEQAAVVFACRYDYGLPDYRQIYGEGEEVNDGAMNVES